jgi:hypothetical protein
MRLAFTYPFFPTHEPIDNDRSLGRRAYPVGISKQTTNIPQLAGTIMTGTITRKLPPAGRGLTFNLAAPP